MSDDARCFNCRYYKPIDSSGMTKAIARENPGRCYRFPPTLVQVHARWEWPLVYARHVCGEWTKSKAIAEPKT